MIVRDLLFVPIDNMWNIADWIKDYAVMGIAAIFPIALILEKFGECNFSGILARLFFAFFIIVIYKGAITNSAEIGFQISDEIISKYAQNNAIVVGFDKSRNISAKYTKQAFISKVKKFDLWGVFSIMLKSIFNDPVALIAWLFTYVSTIAVRALYSTVYALAQVLTCVVAALSIIGVFQKAVGGIFITLAWLLLTPIIYAIILVAMNSIMDFTVTGDASIGDNLKSLIQFGVMSLILLGSPFVATALVKGSGLGEFADKVASSLSVGMMAGVGAKMLTMVGGIGPRVMGSLGRHMRGSLSFGANKIRNEKGLNPTLKELKGVGNVGEAKRKAKRSTSLGEKLVLGADSIFNSSDNFRAKTARANDANSVILDDKNKNSRPTLSAYLPKEKSSIPAEYRPSQAAKGGTVRPGKKNELEKTIEEVSDLFGELKDVSNSLTKEGKKQSGPSNQIKKTYSQEQIKREQEAVNDVAARSNYVVGTKVHNPRRNNKDMRNNL